MQNIQVICEKILQGPVPQVMNPFIQTETSFMDLLKILTHDTETEEVILANSKISDSNENGVEVIEQKSNVKVDVSEESYQQALGYLWINNNLIPTNDESPIPNCSISTVNTSVSQSQLIRSDYLIKDAELISSMKFDLNEAVVSLSPEKFVIETVDKNEIHEHFKILNQTTKLKEVVKNEEAQPINFSVKQDLEVIKSHEIELNDVQMNEFKQSIDEMKGLIEQMSKKEDQTIIFKLKPEGLAEIVIKFEQKLGKVVLDISTPNKVVEQLIQKELPQLRDSLKSFQMEVNLNEMSYKNQSDQSRQPKYYQERQVLELVEEEKMNEEWVFLPKSYGFNTYV